MRRDVRVCVLVLARACASACSIIIHFHRFLQAPLFNELIYRFLVNNNRAREGGGGVCIYTCNTLYGVRLARGEEKNGLLIFVVLTRRPPIMCLCLPCAWLPPPLLTAATVATTNLYCTSVSPFFHNRRRRRRRRHCATETR